MRGTVQDIKRGCMPVLAGLKRMPIPYFQDCFSLTFKRFFGFSFVLETDFFIKSASAIVLFENPKSGLPIPGLP
jgi:hypothetical protein